MRGSQQRPLRFATQISFTAINGQVEVGPLNNKQIGEVKADKETRETVALLEILLLGNRQIERGETTPLDIVVSRLRCKNSIRD